LLAAWTESTPPVVVRGEEMELMTVPPKEKSLKEMPPSKVEVALEDVAMKYGAAMIEA